MSGIAITFPGSSAEGQSYLAQNGFTYIYDSQKNRWKRGGDFVRAPKVLSYAGVAVTTTGSGITTGPNGALIYNIPGTVSPSSDVGIDRYKAYRYTDSYPNYTEIQVSISSAFSNIAYAATSTSTTFTIPSSTLSGDQTYYLRARQFVGSNASIASTGEISGYSPNVVRFITTSTYLDAPTIVSIAGTTGFPVYQIGFAGTTLPATVTYTGSGVGNLDKVEWRVTGPRNPSSTGDTALAEVGIGTLSSATLANSLVLAMPFSGASGVGITNDVNNAIRTASGASAGTTKIVTAFGNAGIATVGIATTTAHFYNGAAYFDGSGDYLVTASTSTDFACTGDFTIEMWFSPRATGIDHTLWDQRKTASPPISSWALLATSTNTFNVSFGPGPQLTLTGTTIFAIGQWYHLIVCRKSDKCSLFINGVLEAFGTNSFSDASAVSPVIGGRYNAGSGGADWTNGYIQDVKYYKGLAKYQENFTPPLPTYGTISYTTSTIGSVGVATTAFLKSIGDISTAEVAIGSSTAAQVASSLVLALPMNKTFGFQDINVAVRGLTSGASAGTAKTVGLGTTSTANAPSHPIISATESKWYDGSGYFDGGDYAQALSSSDFAFGTDNFTFEFWYYHISGTDRGLFANNSGASVGINFLIGASGPFRVYNGTGANNLYDFSASPVANTWQHIALVRNSGTLTLYVNGISYGSTSWSGVNAGNTATFSVGSAYGDARFAYGYLQDLKVYKGFAKYTANFTPPAPICGFTTDLAIQTGFTTTSATGALLSSVVGLGSTSTLSFGADQNLIGVTSITSSSGISTLPDPYAQNLVLALPLANITGVGNSFTNDRNTQIRSVSITGGGTTKTITNSGIGTTTGFLKGYSNTASGFSRASANSIAVADNADLELGSGNFTIEWWTYLTNTTGQYEGIWSKPGGSDANGLLHHKETDGGLNFAASTGAGNNWNISLTFGSCTLYANRWVHFAVVREGPTFRGYADGILRSTDTDTGTIVDNANSLFIGKYTQFPGGATLGFDGYIQDFKLYKGTAKYTTNFNPPPPMFGDYIRSTPNKIVFTPGSDYALEARNTATGGIVTSTYSATRQWGTKPEGGIYDPYASSLVLAIPGGAVGGATSTFDVTGQIRFETPTATYINAGIVTYSNSLGIGTYGNKSITNVGVALSTNISKYYGRSMYFLGTGNLNSYLSVADSADFDFQGDWTIQCWVYFTRAIGTQEAIWASASDFKRPSVFRLVDGKMGYFASSNGSSWDILNGDAGALNGIGSIIVSSNQWNHVVFQRRGTTYTGYINGVVDLNKSVSGTPFNAAEAFTIGRWGVSYSMQGHIQDFIIYNNLAKYTSNFTPPNQIYLA